jgi:hypothetical protein
MLGRSMSVIKSIPISGHLSTGDPELVSESKPAAKQEQTSEQRRYRRARRLPNCSVMKVFCAFYEYACLFHTPIIRKRFVEFVRRGGFCNKCAVCGFTSR